MNLMQEALSSRRRMMADDDEDEEWNEFFGITIFKFGQHNL